MENPHNGHTRASCFAFETISVATFAFNSAVSVFFLNIGKDTTSLPNFQALLANAAQQIFAEIFTDCCCLVAVSALSGVDVIEKARARSWRWSFAVAPWILLWSTYTIIY